MSKYSQRDSKFYNPLYPTPMSSGEFSFERLKKTEDSSTVDPEFSKSIEDLLTHLEFDIHAGYGLAVSAWC